MRKILEVSTKWFSREEQKLKQLFDRPGFRAFDTFGPKIDKNAAPLPVDLEAPQPQVERPADTVARNVQRNPLEGLPRLPFEPK
jgi:hypothetical protein